MLGGERGMERKREGNGEGEQEKKREREGAAARMYTLISSSDFTKQHTHTSNLPLSVQGLTGAGSWLIPGQESR